MFIKGNKKFDLGRYHPKAKREVDRDKSSGDECDALGEEFEKKLQVSTASSRSILAEPKIKNKNAPQHTNTPTRLRMKLDDRFDQCKDEKDFEFKNLQFVGKKFFFETLDLQGAKVRIKPVKWEAPGININGRRSSHTFSITGLVTIGFGHKKAMEFFGACSKRYDKGCYPLIEFEIKSQTIWLVFEWNKTRAHWLPRFVDRRPFFGGFHFKNGNCKLFKDQFINESLRAVNIRSDQSLLMFDLVPVAGESLVARFVKRAPLKKGVRMAVLRDYELNPEKEAFPINEEGEPIAITFRPPRAAMWLKKMRKQKYAAEWPYFKIRVTNGKDDVDILLKLNWNANGRRWIPIFSAASLKEKEKEEFENIQTPIPA